MREAFDSKAHTSRPVETRCMTAGLFDPAQIPTVCIRPANAGGTGRPFPRPELSETTVQHRLPYARCSLRAPGARPPAARIGLQAGLIGDADGGVADVQAVASTLHRGVLEGEAGCSTSPARSSTR